MPDVEIYSAMYMAELPKKSLYDDLLFSAVCEDSASVEDLLRPVMEMPCLEVVAVRPQANRPNIVGHSGRMDVTAVDKADGTLYDVELQQWPTDDMEKRVRLYAAFLDVEAYNRGREGYKTARNTVVAVYCGFDPCKDEPPEMVGGQPLRPELYPVGRCHLRTGHRFHDGSRIVFFNGDNERDTPCGRLARDLRCTDGTKMHNKRLGARFDFLKRNPKGVEIMEMRSNQFSTAIKTEIAKNMLSKGLSVDIAAECAELPLAVVQGLMAQRAQGQPAMR